MEGTRALCDADIAMGTKRRCVISSILTGGEKGERMRSREGELRACRKVGSEKEALKVDSAKSVETSAGESIDEQIEKIVSIPDLSSIGSAEVHSEVKLSEEGTRGVSASIAFK